MKAAYFSICTLLSIFFIRTESVAAGLDAKLLSTAKAHYYQAVDGDGKALKEASALLEALRTDNPQHPLVMAYAGSVQLLQASRTMAVWRKGKLAQEGLSALDEAVRLAPQDVEVRFVRAASTFHLPGMFRRKAQSKEDFEWLASRVAAAVGANTLDRRLGAAALYHHGLFLHEAGDVAGARLAWQETVRIGIDTRAAMDAKARLGGR